MVDSGEALADKLQVLMSAPDQCARLGQAAAAVVEANRGALEKGLELIAMEMNVGLRPSG